MAGFGGDSPPMLSATDDFSAAQGGTITIQSTPNWSSNMPKAGDQNVLPSDREKPLRLGCMAAAVE
jgi:hypothetical protein